MSKLTPDQLVARLNTLAQDTANPPDLMHKIVLTVEGNVKPRVPVRTGNLRRSITSVVDSPSRGRVGTNVEYAQYVHDGTRYIKARPFFEEGVEASQARIEALVQQAGNEMLQKVGG